MARPSLKMNYISCIVWEIDHFKEELKRTVDSKEFKPVLYLGNQFTRYAAERIVQQYESELKKIANDETYTPWKTQP